jgi:LmbE family N-acetylglucosaminyl deacetylase
MKRRKFISDNLALGAAISGGYTTMAFSAPQGPGKHDQDKKGNEIFIEKTAEGKPHEGKVLAVIQPHNDDIPLFAAGTVAKLIYEGYTGYLIRTSNDDAAGKGSSMGERVLNNEKDNEEVALVLGLKKVYSLNYSNHRMDEYNIQDIKARFIFLFRLLKVDTLICYDPWSQYEENPDHYITARAVEAARWMAGMNTDYPEQLEVVEPHAVKEMYYYARGPQIVNRVVDISKFIDIKVKSTIACKTQGPGGDSGALLRRSLAEKGKKLPILGDDDETANFSYIKEFVMDKDSEYWRGIPSDRSTGEKFGLEWAECFHYIGPSSSNIDSYVERNAVEFTPQPHSHQAKE